MSAFSIEPIPFLPVYKRVVIDPVEAEEVTRGGIIIPQTAQTRANRGRLIAAGLQALDILASHGIKLGDTVLIGKYAGVWQDWTPESATSVGEVKHLLLAQVDDILCSEGLAERVKSGDVSCEANDRGRFSLVEKGQALDRYDPKVTG